MRVYNAGHNVPSKMESSPYLLVLCVLPIQFTLIPVVPGYLVYLIGYTLEMAFLL